MSDVHASLHCSSQLLVLCIRFSGNRVVACATKQILAGEEINNCYGESGGGYLRDSEIHLFYCTVSM